MPLFLLFPASSRLPICQLTSLCACKTLRCARLVPRTPSHGKVAKSPRARKMLDRPRPDSRDTRLGSSWKRSCSKAALLLSSACLLAQVVSRTRPPALTPLLIFLFCPSLSLDSCMVFCHRSFDRMETRPSHRKHRTCFSFFVSPNLPCHVID